MFFECANVPNIGTPLIDSVEVEVLMSVPIGAIERRIEANGGDVIIHMSSNDESLASIFWRNDASNEISFYPERNVDSHDEW
jgi:hypothetical protein